MVTTTLGTPLADQAIRDVNFFNGRLLTGGDLSREQAARRLADRRVAQAVGPGVAWGLEVSALAGGPANNVQVMAGLGVTDSGLVLNLSGDTVVQLVPPPAQAQTALGDGGFSPCGGLAGATSVAADGLYLLTLAPLSTPEGWAPVLALDDVNKRCSTDAYIEAAQLRLLPITGINLTGTDAASVARLRNQLAYTYFDAERVAAAHAGPGHPPSPGSTVTDGRTPCDLPLAVVYIRFNAVVFIDNGAVRRRIAPRPASVPWADWVGDTVTALGEAQMLQFQEHLLATPSLQNAAATALLDWLPPAGFLRAGTPLASLKTFLGARAPEQEMPLAAADAPALLADALRADAVKLSAAAAGSRYRAWRIGGTPAGALLFARDRRNVLAAEQVWLDGGRAGRPQVTDVQTALDQLLAGSCLHVVLHKGSDLAGTLRAIGPNDATICFEAGRYELESPLVIENAGRIRVQGHGATLVNRAGECALRILACEAADVSDIAFEGQGVGQGKGQLGLGLHGALTVVDTPRVSIDGVQARCAGASALGAACIVVVVRDAAVNKQPRASFTVSGCDMQVGKGQQGLLCVNGDVLALRGNQIAAADGKTALQRGIVVAGRRAGTVQIENNIVRDVVRGIAVGLSEGPEEEGQPLLAGRVHVERNRVELQLKEVTTGGRYGIFIGNAGSVVAHANHVVLVGGDVQKLQPQAMRLAGVYGPQIVVRDNYFAGTWRGIALEPKFQPLKQVWAFQCNVGRGLGAEILYVSPAYARLVIDEHNVKVIEIAPPAPQ